MPAGPLSQQAWPAEFLSELTAGRAEGQGGGGNSSSEISAAINDPLASSFRRLEGGPEAWGVPEPLFHGRWHAWRDLASACPARKRSGGWEGSAWTLGVFLVHFLDRLCQPFAWLPAQGPSQGWTDLTAEETEAHRQHMRGHRGGRAKAGTQVSCFILDHFCAVPHGLSSS